MRLFFFIQIFFIAKSHAGSQNKKASMMFLSKEASNKDQQLKTQMMISFQDDQAKNTEHVQANFPENTLIYVNQGSVSLVKGGG